jgi:hypothetical protein
LDSQYRYFNERKKNNPIVSKSEETMESFIKDSLIMKKGVSLLNISESIQKLQKMITIKSNKLFIDKYIKILISLLKYKKLIKKKMQK